jgi:hypothetical protein
MKLTSGELYFIREQDFLTQKFSQYVKIGLIKDNGDRSSVDRLLEHQTANPRQLILFEVLATPAIIEVEKTMHGLMAPNRVSGEWFHLSEVELEKAITTAKSLVDEINQNLDALEQAKELDSALSDDTVLDPTSKALINLEKYHRAKAIVSQYESLKKRFDQLLSIAIENGENIGNIASKQTRSTSKFDEERLKADLPEIYAEFMVEKQTPSKRFLPSRAQENLAISEISPEFFELTRQFNVLLDSRAVNHANSSEFHVVYRQMTVHYYRSLLDVEISEANIKAECGFSKEIKGICKWKREIKHAQLFDKVKFAENYPDLEAKYTMSNEISAMNVNRKNQYNPQQ